SANTKSRGETAVERVKSALQGSNLDEIKSASEALTQIWHEASAQLYEQTTAQQGPQQEPGYTPQGAPTEEPSAQKSSDEDVIDADYEVVDDDKK
ncbi:MAG: molecular chaperone DnaK, partial [Planctomycetota bacterium]